MDFKKQWGVLENVIILWYTLREKSPEVDRRGNIEDI